MPFAASSHGENALPSENSRTRSVLKIDLPGVCSAGLGLCFMPQVQGTGALIYLNHDFFKAS